MDNFNALDDNVLEAVSGGTTVVDWQLFSTKLLTQITNFNIPADDIKEIVEIIKTKSWTDLKIKILPFAARDTNLMALLMECIS